MYPSNITDKQWQKVSHFFKRSDPRGSLVHHDKRDIVNAIFYIVRGGVQWRMLPNDFPPWQTVYNNYRRWNMRGIWEQVLDSLNESYRIHQGRKPEPSYGIIDSQSVKTIYKSDERGIDGGKKNKG